MGAGTIAMFGELLCATDMFLSLWCNQSYHYGAHYSTNRKTNVPPTLWVPRIGEKSIQPSVCTKTLHPINNHVVRRNPLDKKTDLPQATLYFQEQASILNQSSRITL